MKLRKELIILNEICKKGAVDLITYRQEKKKNKLKMKFVHSVHVMVCCHVESYVLISKATPRGFDPVCACVHFCVSVTFSCYGAWSF